MAARTLLGLFLGAGSALALWFVGVHVYFSDLEGGVVPLDHQVHLLTVIACALLIWVRAAVIRGSAQDKLQQVCVTAALVFGAYAFAILVGRFFFSRTILATAVPFIVVVAIGIAWLRHRRGGMKVAVLAPLVNAAGRSLPNASLISDPSQDLSRFDIVLADLHRPVTSEWAHAFSRALRSGCRIRHIHDHVEEMQGHVSISQFELEHLPSTEFEAYVQVKRWIDVFACLLLAPIAILIVLTAGLGILLTSGWPVFFVQDRVGLGGDVFRMWKLRTMRVARPGEEVREAVPGDARVTPIGRWLRRLRIDELPQLWNVLRGDMSLIGPRPEAVPFHNAYTEAHPKFAFRCLVRPGISGWAQVNAPPSASADEALEKLKYDLFYVKRQSLLLDLQIAVRTIGVITHGAGVR